MPTVYDDDDRVVVRLSGYSNNLNFRLGPIHAKRLGLAPLSDKHPYALVLDDDADPNALLELPNGRRFTAEDLTNLSSKSGDSQKGWEIWSEDPGGYPSYEMD